MATDRHAQVQFRPVEIDTDVHLLKVWLEDPDVSPWYGVGETSVDNLRQKFAPEETTRKYIFQIDGNPAGYLQTYRLADEPEYAAQIDLGADAGCIDLLIGDAAFRNRGWGVVVLEAALDRLIFGEMACDVAMIAPSPDNLRAVRAYERAGYQATKTVYIQADEPENTGNELVMVQSRDLFRARFPR